MTTLTPELRQAFAHTQYHALHHPTPFLLQVGQPQPALNPIYQQHQTDCVCLLTAFNPMGELLDKEENIERHAQLSRALHAAGYATGVRLDGRELERAGGSCAQDAQVVTDRGQVDGRG